MFRSSRSRLRLLLAVATATVATDARLGAQTLEQMRTDQLERLQTYVLDAVQPSGLVRDSLVLSPSAAHFHPATPDAAGFALLALSAFDEFGQLPNAAGVVENILSAYNGDTPGVTPDRSADGHYVHFMNVATGAKQGGGWDESYSPIGSALLTAGAQFAKRHFAGNDAIASLADQITASIDFNAAIHPSLDGRIYLDMTKAGGGAGGTVRPWNEYMLVESLALRQPNNDRAVAVKHLWLNPDNLPVKYFSGTPTLTDNPGAFAPAFWVQQSQFFNSDFRADARFQEFLASQQQADSDYAEFFLADPFRYGLTAGVTPDGYHADRIFDHPSTVLTPAAVSAWGDMDTLLQWYQQQDPTSDARYRYGLARESLDDVSWVPYDAGLVDHLFLLFGIVESIDPGFFAARLFAPLQPGDYNLDGTVDAADYTLWRDTLGSTTDLSADGDLDGQVGPGDYQVWRASFGAPHAASGADAAPAPGALALACFGGLAVALSARGVRHKTLFFAPSED